MGAKAAGEALLVVEEVSKHFPTGAARRWRRGSEAVHAVDGVSLSVSAGETLGLVGESGCGKSTLARCIARLVDVSSGRIVLDGRDITELSQRRMRPIRQDIQMIFQDPYGSLNPKRRVGSIIGDPFAIHKVASGRERKRRIQDLMELVGLNPEHYNRFPAEFSGGQRQRIGVARALALRPKVVICDEPVSALDVSIQAQIINLLSDLQDELGLTYVFIAHDLSVVRHVSDRVALMYSGKIVELGSVEDFYRAPLHPYAHALIAAMPLPDPRVARGRERPILAGEAPSPIHPPRGCRFHPRCPRAQGICADREPQLAQVAPGPAHLVACHFPVKEGEKLSGPGPSPTQVGALADKEPQVGMGLGGEEGA